MSKRMLFEVHISFFRKAIHEISQVPNMTCTDSEKSFISFCSYTIFKLSFNDLERVTSSRRKSYLQHVTFYPE
jgi:hypothetical protein